MSPKQLLALHIVFGVAVFVVVASYCIAVFVINNKTVESPETTNATSTATTNISTTVTTILSESAKTTDPVWTTQPTDKQSTITGCSLPENRGNLEKLKSPSTVSFYVYIGKQTPRIGISTLDLLNSKNESIRMKLKYNVTQGAIFETFYQYFQLKTADSAGTERTLGSRGFFVRQHGDQIVEFYIEVRKSDVKFQLGAWNNYSRKYEYVEITEEYRNLFNIEEMHRYQFRFDAWECACLLRIDTNVDETERKFPDKSPCCLC